ncbi:hypothetical protein MKX08_008026 [Trichoderma sp. CBMAI-0020]|nr:hypothetical protein MKX08_008026 [Trichoderma sp. CBMAI-0020]
MPTTNPPSFFISLPVVSLNSATDFYKSLSFTPLPDFSDANTSAFRFPYKSSSNICLMLHSTTRFGEFVRHGSEIIHAKKVTGAIYTLGVASRNDVDGLLEKAEQGGGKKDPFTMEGYGKSVGIYTRSFEDLDGHIWEATTMLEKKEEVKKDEKKGEKKEEKKKKEEKGKA